MITKFDSIHIGERFFCYDMADTPAIKTGKDSYEWDSYEERGKSQTWPRNDNFRCDIFPPDYANPSDSPVEVKAIKYNDLCLGESFEIDRTTDQGQELSDLHGRCCKSGNGWSIDGHGHPVYFPELMEAVVILPKKRILLELTSVQYEEVKLALSNQINKYAQRNSIHSDLRKAVVQYVFDHVVTEARISVGELPPKLS